MTTTVSTAMKENSRKALRGLAVLGIVALELSAVGLPLAIHFWTAPVIPELTRDEMLAMAGAMHRYGGSFVKALSECFLLADGNNKTRLYRAFPKYVKQYTDMAKVDAKQTAQEAVE